MASHQKSLATAFDVDTRITIKIEPELATALGKLILETTTDNTALLALGHQLRSLTNVVKRPDNAINVD